MLWDRLKVLRDMEAKTKIIARQLELVEQLKLTVIHKALKNLEKCKKP